MNSIPQKRQLAELVSTIVKPLPVNTDTPNPAARMDRANPAAQLRMEAKQAGESGANHARHHVSRKTQS